MYLRFLSAVGLMVFVLFSINPLYAQVGTTQCSDGIDNDADGKIDFVGTNADPDCTSATDNDESNQLTICPENKIVNGSFEQPTIVNPATQNLWKVYGTSTDNVPAIPGWQPELYQVELQKTGFIETAADGSQYAEVDSPGNVLLRQQISTVVGRQYVLDFSYAPRRDVSSLQKIGVYWNGTLVGTAEATPSAGSTTIQWQQKNFTMTASSTTSTLGFGCINCLAGAGNFLDNVVLREKSSTCSAIGQQCSDGVDNDADGKIDFVAPVAAPTIPATYDFTVPFPGSTPDQPVPLVPAKPGHGQDIYSVMRGKFPASFPSPGAAGIVATMFYNNQPTADKICLMLGYQTAVKNRVYAYSHSQHKVSMWENNAWVEKPISGGFNNVLYGLICSNPIATGGTILADPECSSATDNTESGDLTCPAGQSRKPTPESPVCILTASPTTSPAGTIFVLTGYEHLTGNCTLAGMTAHVPSVAITPTLPLTTLTVSPTLLTVSATSTGSFTGADVVARLLTCPAGNSTCSIGTGGVISCGCYNAGITPPTGTTTTTPTSTIPATYDFKTSFPGISYTVPGAHPGWDIVNVARAKDPSIQPGPIAPTVSNLFSYTQATADKVCQLMGYQTAVMSWPYGYSHSQHKVTAWENNAWVLKGGKGPGMNALTCSNPLPGAPVTTTTSIVTPPTYICVSDLCTEGQYFCSAENKCKPAKESCSAITCNKNDICEVGESCNCSDCTTGTLENTKDKCGLGLEGNQLYCTKDSVVASNTTFPFCLPACLDGQACTTTCSQQVGACCPAGTNWSSAANSCVPATCGEGQFYCAAQKKCLAGGTTCDTTVCVNDGVCSGEESCQCADCVNGGDDDRDKCSIIGGVQAMCSDDILSDNKPGACCIPPKKWDSTANAGVGACVACSNTQAPAELKANYDQPYITCTGNGVVADTHFRYRITKQGSTEAPFISDIFQNSKQVLHPKMSEGAYKVQCFYGNATVVNTSSTAVPHTCEKTMQVKTDNANAVQGCNRIYAYRGTTLSDEITSQTGFEASFRCGARLPAISPTNPFSLHIGTIAPQLLMADTFMTAFLAEYQLGAISTQTQAHNFNTGSTPVSCAVQVGGGYSTNDYCRATACVGNNCNVPQAFSVVHSGDRVCTTEQTDTYNIGCNPDAPDDVRTQCVEMFQSAVNNAGAGAASGAIFRLSFSFNGTLNTQVECRKYPAGDPNLHNIYNNVSCTAILNNGEYYNIYAADSSGNQINSLQTTARTMERDATAPVLEPIKYYTDSSLSLDVPAGTWTNKPLIAVAVCRDAPTTESASCSCAPAVHGSTTNSILWSLGVQHGTVEIGPDLFRYSRTISESLTTPQSVAVVDTAGNISTPAQTLSVALDTDAPIMNVSESATTATRDITLTVTDSLSKIWKATLAPTTPTATNTQGIIWRKGLKANVESLTFGEDCDITPIFANFSETQAPGFPATATVIIPAVNTATEVVTYCIRDNAGNTTRGIYPVLTDACFSATNMSPIPTFDTYRNITSTRLASTTATANQKYGYSFSESTANAACFRGILATNIQTLVTNQLQSRTGTTLTNWDTDRALVKNSSTTLNTNGYYYYRYTSSTNNTLSMTTSPSGGGTKSVIVEGGNIHIKENIVYSGTGNTLLLIARRNSAGNGGDIIIDPTVTRIDGVLIADGGALKSSDASTPGDRLVINGRIYSYNTRGGSLQPSGTTDVINASTPQIFTASGALAAVPSLADAQKQDLERLRPSFVDSASTCSLHLTYYAYTTTTLPLLLQRPVGYQGGNCGF